MAWSGGNVVLIIDCTPPCEVCLPPVTSQVPRTPRPPSALSLLVYCALGCTVLPPWLSPSHRPVVRYLFRTDPPPRCVPSPPLRGARLPAMDRPEEDEIVVPDTTSAAQAG